jgi:hypothetical protein
MKNIFKLKSWIRYSWITGLVFAAHYFSGFLEEKVMDGEPFAWIYLFVWYLLFIGIGDVIIRSLLKGGYNETI